MAYRVCSTATEIETTGIQENHKFISTDSTGFGVSFGKGNIRGGYSLHDEGRWIWNVRVVKQVSVFPASCRSLIMIAREVGSETVQCPVENNTSLGK